MTKQELIHIGSISHATMRLEDLIPCFMDYLESYPIAASMDYKEIVDSLNPESTDDDPFNDLRDDQINQYFESEQAYFDLDWLFDQLDDLCHDGYYFGAHIGDDSDYGFWSKL